MYHRVISCTRYITDKCKKRNREVMKFNAWYLVGIFFILLINLFFRLLFIFYGYIATEEGTLIYNQNLAYEGKLPFIDYDAWNSWLHDYLIGWTKFITAPSIVSQRIFGFFLSCINLLITLQIAKVFGNRRIFFLLLPLITFGSFTYTYLSTIPYSEQTMTFGILLSTYFLTKTIVKPSLIRNSIVCIILLSLTALIRIQALLLIPVTIIYLFYIYKRNIRLTLIFLLTSLTTITIGLLPFASKNIESIGRVITWPLIADKILVYQKNINHISFNQYLIFAQESFRDYGVFLIFIGAGIFITKLNTSRKNPFSLYLLTIVVSVGGIGIIHKPPYASYIYPVVPIMAIYCAYALNNIIEAISQISIRTCLYIILLLMFLQNVLLYPHHKLIKTSFANIELTPHAYLQEVVNFVQSISEPDDEILSFYTPITILSNRKVVPRFNRDRFSISHLNPQQARKYHLLNEMELQNYVSSKKAKVIIFSNKNIQYFASTQEVVDDTKQEIELRYDLVKVFTTMQFIENPNIETLFIYQRKP